MTAPIQLPPDIVQTTGGSGAHKHMNYIQSNINGYDQSVLSDIDPDIHYNNCVDAQYYNENSFNKVFKDSNELSLMHLNIRSVPAHFSQFRAQLDLLSIRFKVIALSETAINSYHTCYNIPSYTIEQDFRPKRKGGGVALYIANTLKYTPRSDLSIGGDTNSIFVEIDKSDLKTKYNIVIGCIYRPPSYSLKSFNDLVTDKLSILQREKKHIYLAGDFNVNTDPLIRGNINIQNFKNMFSSNFLFPLINKPTRVTQQSSTIIDNIYCNENNLESSCKSGIFRLSISDHYAIFCIINTIHVRPDKHTIIRRNFNQKNICKFTKCIKNEVWIVLNSLDVQNAFSWFQRVIDLHFGENFPKRTFTMTYKNRLPWLTEKLRTQIKDKNAMHTMVILHPDDQLLRVKYKKLRNELTSLIRNSEINHYSDELELHKSDLHKTWGIMKTIIGKDSNNSKSSLKFQVNGKCITDSLEIANSFNNFFVSVGPKLAQNIISTVNPMSYVTPCNNSIVIPPVTIAEVSQVISSLKNSSAGWDEIPALVAKQSHDSYIEPLTCLINRCFHDGIFPTDLKLARVVPIFKSGDSPVLSNYRPISILSFFAKVFEKLLYKYLLDFLDSNNVLYKHQFGFREKHCTQQAIVSLVEKITQSWDTDDIVIGVFIDLKKAFDTVPHDILLKKMYAYGIRGNAFKLLKSYLTDRTQYVVYDSKQSETLPIKCGVPQGSILGPLLFICVMNDIGNVSDFLYTILYADDTSVLLNGKCYTDLVALLNSELEKLSLWLQSNKLSLNVQKTYYIVFHRARIKSDEHAVITINNVILQRTNSLKYLGVIIDYKLNWTQHIAHVKNKISKGIGIMYRARNYLSKVSMRKLYYSYIYPYLIYCIEVWGISPHTHLKPLLLLQKKIVRIMTFSSYYAHTAPIFKDLKILTIDKLIVHRIGITMYKYSNGLLPDVFNTLYIKNSEIHTYSTRSKDLYHVLPGTQTFSNISAKIWNSLTVNINVNVTFIKFKESLKLYLLNNTLLINYTK